MGFWNVFKKAAHRRRRVFVEEVDNKGHVSNTLMKHHLHPTLNGPVTGFGETFGVAVKYFEFF
jgi:hypothetical protein